MGILLSLLAITLGSILITMWCMSPRRYGYETLGATFCTIAIIAACCLLFGLFGVPLSRYSDRQFLAEFEAVRATERGPSIDSAMWRLKIADLNGDLAKHKFDRYNFPLWHVPELETTKPIDASK